jgi:hypothetical protein
MLGRFFDPYVRLLMRAAWSAQQNLVASGKWSPSITHYDSDGVFASGEINLAASLMPLLGPLALIVICGLPLLLLASYVLGKRRGVVIAMAARHPR